MGHWTLEISYFPCPPCPHSPIPSLQPPVPNYGIAQTTATANPSRMAATES